MPIDTRVETLLIKAREEVYTLLSGNNFSQMQGEGYDLSEIREYQVGDDVRKINWIITAKMRKPYIKELHSNRELSIAVAPLMDGSLYFGDTNNKQYTIAETTALLGYATYKNSDIFTGIACRQEQSIYRAATKNIYSIESFVKRLYRYDTLGTKLAYTQVPQEIFARLHKRSILFIIGDFLQEIDLSLLAQRHEVIALIIRDRGEEEVQKMGEVTLQDPSSHRAMDTYFGQKSIQRYQAHLAKNDQAHREHYAKYNIRHLKIYTDEDILSRLMELF